MASAKSAYVHSTYIPDEITTRTSTTILVHTTAVRVHVAIIIYALRHFAARVAPPATVYSELEQAPAQAPIILLSSGENDGFE
jgi:hypothetical protein